MVAVNLPISGVVLYLHSADMSDVLTKLKEGTLCSQSGLLNCPLCFGVGCVACKEAGVVVCAECAERMNLIVEMTRTGKLKTIYNE